VQKYNHYTILQISQFVIVLMLQLSSLAVLASGPSIRFEHLSIEHGLPQNSANNILQDSQGFLWIGTQGGLARYDGYNFKVFKHDNDEPHSLSNNYIQAIFEDSQGILWLGTDGGGLNRFNPKTEQFRHYRFDAGNPNSLSDDRVFAITEDQQGTLWLGTLGGGLNRFNAKTEQFSHYRFDASDPSSLSNDRVFAITKDQQGELWVGTSGGLNRFNRNTEQFSHYRYDASDPTSLSVDNVLAIFEDQQGTLWVGTSGGGLNRFDRKTEQFSHYRFDANNPNSLSNDRVFAITEEQQGALWVGTSGGLNRFNRKTEQFSHYRFNASDPTSLSIDNVLAIFEDQQGTLWVGTSGGGLNRFNAKTEQFGHYRFDANNPNSLSNDIVFAIKEDQQGGLWLGTRSGGLNRYNRNTEQFNHYRFDASDPTSLSSDYVLAIAEDQQGTLWVGTYGGGLNRFDRKTEQFDHYRFDASNPTSLSDDHVFAITADQQGALWVGTNGGGLNRFDAKTEQFDHYRFDASNPGSLSSDYVLAITEDQQGTLWVGTRGSGLNRFNRNTEQFVHYRFDANDPNSLSSDTVVAIAEDSNGTLWLGSADGLNRMDKQSGKFKRFTVKQGLPSNFIYRIEEDNDGLIWLSTEQGLSRFNPETERFKNYDVSDGLQNNEFNFGASYKSKRGELFFGGLKGFNRFFPAKLTADDQKPSVVFTDMLIMNRSVPISPKQDALENSTESFNNGVTLEQAIYATTALTLTHKESLVSFEFSALNFINPKKNQYAYRLQGFDSDWIKTDYKKRFATYTNLPSGDFVLQVKASNSAGLWNEEGAALNITVLPPPWRSWWAYLLYLTIIFSITGLFILQQIKKRQANNEQNKLLKLALWGSGDELWDVNLVDNTYVTQNRPVALALNEEPHTVRCYSPINTVHSEDKLAVSQAYSQHINGAQQYYEATYRALTKTGEWVWLLDRGQINEYDENGQAVRFSGTTKNIQHLKTVEQELRALTTELEQRVETRTLDLKLANEELVNTQKKLVETEKMAALGHLVVGISHELNTPVSISLTAITSFKDKVISLNEVINEGQLSKKYLVEFLEYAGTSAQLALSNIEKTSKLVSYFKKTSVDQSSEEISNIRLADLIKSVFVSCQTTEKLNDVAFELHCPEELTISTYRNALASIFTQLINNTLSHGFNTSTLEQARIHITVNVAGTNVIILYRDSGLGMDEETIKHLFTPFYTTKRAKNIGLGMYVVYNQVTQLCQGSIECSSEPEKGSSFILKLPSL
jgi:ligand-binding sensor domain-containing protein/signal transduction histidine kinase